jgi:hypothetical protein
MYDDDMVRVSQEPSSLLDSRVNIEHNQAEHSKFNHDLQNTIYEIEFKEEPVKNNRKESHLEDYFEIQDIGE